MYNWEIEKLLAANNYYIGGDDLISVISPHNNPQLTRIRRYEGEWQGKKNQVIYEMEAKGDFNVNEVKKFTFCAMPYDEAKAKGLVKVKK